MKIHTGTSLERLNKPVVSIGIFDGVHKGHAAVFKRMCRRARERNGESAIVTFWPHPRKVLGKNGDKLKFLTTLIEKQALLRHHEIDHLFIMPFTKEFARLPACKFVKDYLVDKVGLTHLVFGFDHHFGRKREGNYENLKTCAGLYGFTIEQLDPVAEEGIMVSSSVIRNALLVGNVRFASKLLSYYYNLQGTIVGGNKIGRVIGYPTANLELDYGDKLIPADGVYAVRVFMGEKKLMGMMNIGCRPTVNEVADNKSIEVHIIDFEDNVYHRHIKVSFIDRIRDEINFVTLERLKKQLEKDKAKAVQILSENPVNL